MKKALMTAILIATVTLARAVTVASVDGDPVDSSEVDGYVELMKADPRLAGRSEEEARRLSFEKIIELRILSLEAARRGLNKSKKYVELLKTMKSRDKNASGGSSVDKIERDSIRREALKSLLMEDVFTKAKVEEAMVEQMRKSYEETYKESKYYRFERIALDNDDDLKKAYDELGKDVAFSEVKRKFGSIRENVEMVFVLNSVDLMSSPDEAKLGEALAKIEPGTYNKEPIEFEGHKFIFKMNEVETFESPSVNEKNDPFRERAKRYQAQLDLAKIIGAAKIEIKDDRYKYFGEQFDRFSRNLDN